VCLGAGIDRYGGSCTEPEFELRTVQTLASQYIDWGYFPFISLGDVLNYVQASTGSCAREVCYVVTMCITDCGINLLAPAFYI
jgi:hypothetical protein